MAESATARVQGASFADEDMGMARVDSVWSVHFRKARARIHAGPHRTADTLAGFAQLERRPLSNQALSHLDHTQALDSCPRSILGVSERLRGDAAARGGAMAKP